MVVVHRWGGLRGIWAGDAANVLHEAVLEGDWCGQEQRVEGRAVEAFPDERTGADDQKRIRIRGVVRELFGADGMPRKDGTGTPAATVRGVRRRWGVSSCRGSFLWWCCDDAAAGPDALNSRHCRDFGDARVADQVLGDGGRTDVVTVSGQCCAQPHDGVVNLMIDGLPVVVGWRERALNAAAAFDGVAF
jgi:hypothetical protein